MTPASTNLRQAHIRVFLSYGLVFALTLIAAENIPTFFALWQSGNYPTALAGSFLSAFLVSRMFFAWKAGHLQFRPGNLLQNLSRPGLGYIALLFFSAWGVFLVRLVQAANSR